MGFLALVMLAAAEFDDANLVALAMAFHRCDHLGRTHVGGSNGHRRSGTDQQHLIEFDTRALVCVELLDTHHGTFLNAVLFTARGNHGIHFMELQERLTGPQKSRELYKLAAQRSNRRPPGATTAPLQPTAGSARVPR